MRINKNIVFSSVMVYMLLFVISCSKKQPEGGKGPELEVFSKTVELPSVPKEPSTGKAYDEKGANIAPLKENIVKQSLVGVWVLKGESCESSNGIIFDNGGKYASDGEEGVWHAAGNKIEIDVSNGETGTDEYQKTEPLRIKVLTLEADTAIVQRPDGSNVEWKRCPAVPNLDVPKSDVIAK